MASLGDVTHIVIHHSASARSTTFNSVRRWHTAPKPLGNGWSDIGYHFVILGNGKLRRGRPLGTRGAHAPPNTGKIGICVVGNNLHERSQWTPEQVFTLKRVVDALRVIYPEAEVVGHRDASTTVTKCPGVNLEALNIV